MTFDLDNWLLGSSCHVLDVPESSHGHNIKKLLPKLSVRPRVKHGRGQSIMFGGGLSPGHGERGSASL